MPLGFGDSGEWLSDDRFPPPCTVQAYTDERSVKVFDRAKIRRRYFMSSFFFDFVAVLPIDVLARSVAPTQ